MKEIIIAIVAAVAASVATWLFTTAETATDAVTITKAANEIVKDEEFIEVLGRKLSTNELLIDHMKSDEGFRGANGANGANGISPSPDSIAKALSQDENFLGNVKPWPSGQYCILKHGSCPVNFSESSAGLFGIWMFAGENRLSNGGKYLYSGRLGDSYVSWHGGDDRKQSPGQTGTVSDGDWHGELMLFACCKDR